VGVRLHNPGYDHAKRLVKEGQAVADERDQWSEHQPSAEDENRYLENHSWADYGHWHLAVDDEQRAETKGHYKFPYGDFEKVHRCGVIAAEARAAQQKYSDVERAAAHLHGMLDALA
jgi:hypothetical protein